MRRSGAVKFPNSVHLFKFCYKLLSAQRNEKVNDQDIGAILEFNPSDCSHWKRGEKNVKSVFALAKLAESLKVDACIIHDLASGQVDLDEAIFEYSESKEFNKVIEEARTAGRERMDLARRRVGQFVAKLHEQCEFRTAPLYLPEVLRFFSLVQTQPVDMMDRLSRILKIKPGRYAIQYRKGEMKPQTRMSVAKDLAKIVLDAERARYPELGPLDPVLLRFEMLLFVADLMAPKSLLQSEVAKLDSRRNLVADLAAIFWIPKTLLGFQLQDVVRMGETAAISTAAAASANAGATVTGDLPSRAETTVLASMLQSGRGLDPKGRLIITKDLPSAR